MGQLTALPPDSLSALVREKEQWEERIEREGEWKGYVGWWRGIVVKTAGSAGVLSLSCARLAAGRVTS